MAEINRCYFCGYLGVDVQQEGYYDPITKSDTTRFGCKDLRACYERQQERDREWTQIRQQDWKLGNRREFVAIQPKCEVR